MPPLPSRRQLLRTLGGAGAVALSGCSGATGSDPPVSVTPAPVPTDPPTASATAADATGLATDALELDVAVLGSFDEAGPARITTELRNTSPLRLTARDAQEFVLPFVDDDYVGSDRRDHPVLLLVPDGSRLTVTPPDGPPVPIEAVLPDRPVGGCWRVPVDWPLDTEADRPTATISVGPGEARRHKYDLYFLAECGRVVVAFVNWFELFAGPPAAQRYRVQMAFYLVVDAAMDVSVHAPTAVVWGSSPAD